MNTITFEFKSDIQKNTMLALHQSFEEKSINMDKFLIWVMQNYKPGSSIILRMLNDFNKQLEDEG